MPHSAENGQSPQNPPNPLSMRRGISSPASALADSLARHNLPAIRARLTPRRTAECRSVTHVQLWPEPGTTQAGQDPAQGSAPSWGKVSLPLVTSWNCNAGDGARRPPRRGTAGRVPTGGQRGEAPALGISWFPFHSCPQETSSSIPQHAQPRLAPSLAPPRVPQHLDTCMATSVSEALSTYLIVLVWESKASEDGYPLRMSVTWETPVPSGYTVHP